MCLCLKVPFWFPVFCLCCLTVTSATLTNYPLADTYFETYGSAGRNFGAEPVLRVDQWGGRQAFLRFSLADLPQAKHLLRATLSLYVLDIGFNEAGELPDLKTCIGLYDVVTPWTEMGLNFNTCDGTTRWNQGPGIAGAKYTDVGPAPKPDIGVNLHEHAVPFDPARLTRNSWLEFDITEFVRGRRRAGDKEINLVLRSSLLGRNYTFASREAKVAEQKPGLVFEVADVGPDFALGHRVVTDWKPGTKVELPLQLSPGDARRPRKPVWTITHPARDGQQPVTETKVGGASWAIPDWKPDSAGHYRIQCRIPGPVESAPASKSAAVESGDLYLLSVAPHPRLYVTSETLSQLRQNVQTGTRVTTAFLKWVQAGNANMPKAKFHDMGPHEGTENNALAWLLTHDRQYLSNSLAYAAVVLSKPMREHFKDVHEATFTGASWAHSIALHYDWCFDQLSPEYRQRVRDWLKEAAHWGWVRSGAPIAHNDGGARQLLLASAALAMLGDDPEATNLYRLSRDNFEEHLLAWLNDGGRGGRCGDGGEYEGLHGFFIVKYAWMSQTGTGEDVFSESPFFRNRLRHILFGWYPRRLVSPDGRYSMRTYYSPSGDPTRLGYVGDTQPYQSAAALCARFRATPEAQEVRWLAGDWPTQWMQYCLRWAVLGDFEHIPVREPKELAYLDPGCNTVYARSDWSDDATWVLFENAPFVSAHDSLDAGTFEIFKGDVLAARTGNMDHANVQAPHTLNYLHRTIAANALLIHDAAEKWKGFIAGADGIDDGGGERTNFPLSGSPDIDAYLAYRDIFQRAQINRYRNAPEFTYALADLTMSYNSPQFHGGKLNQAKVTNVVRQLLYLRDLDSVLVFDRVTSTKAEFKKTWLLHSLGELDVLDGNATKVDDGEFHYTGATRAVIRYGWPKPVPSFARCQSVTLLPEQAEVVKIGGRIDLPEGQTEAFPGDRWHGQHRHRHLKDFWVNGTNYPPGNPPETRWFNDPATQWYLPGTPDETGGRGKWRIEVSPSKPSLRDLFFHVLSPRLGTEGPFPTVARISGKPFAGALVTESGKRAAVFFCEEGQPQTQFTVTLPAGEYFLVVADLKPGEYSIALNGRAQPAQVVVQDGILVLANATGKVELTALKR